MARLDSGGNPLPLELGFRFELLEQLRVLAHLEACTKRVALSRLEFQSGPWQTCPDVLAASVVWKKRLSTPTTASEFVRSGITSGEWTARIEPKQLVLLDVAYVVDNLLPPFQNSDLDDAKEGIIRRCKLFSSLGAKSDAIQNAWIA